MDQGEPRCFFPSFPFPSPSFSFYLTQLLLTACSGMARAFFVPVGAIRAGRKDDDETRHPPFHAMPCHALNRADADADCGHQREAASQAV